MTASHVGHVLAAAVVSGEFPPVLQLGDAVLDPDTAGGLRFALAFVHLLVAVGSVLLELAMRWRHDASARLGVEALVAGIGQDLYRRAGPEGSQLDSRSGLRRVLLMWRSREPSAWCADHPYDDSVLGWDLCTPIGPLWIRAADRGGAVDEQHGGVRRLCVAVASRSPGLLASTCRMGGFDRLHLAVETGGGVEVAVAPPGVDELALIRDLSRQLDDRVRAGSSIRPGEPVLMAAHVGIVRVVGDGFGGAAVDRVSDLALTTARALRATRGRDAGPGHEGEAGPAVSLVVSDGLFADLCAEGLPLAGWQAVSTAAGWLWRVQPTRGGAER